MIQNLKILRQAGFFKEYPNLSDNDLFNKLNEIRKLEYSKLFDRDYEPEPIKDFHQLAIQDEKKFIDMDLEADVCAENKVYISVLQQMAKASDGHFNPTDIEEIWSSDEGPIKVSFKSNNQIIEFSPEYMDDWIDERIFEVINDEMKKTSSDRFVLCYGPKEEWFGQNAIHIRLNDAEKSFLKKELNWSFPEE